MASDFRKYCKILSLVLVLVPIVACKKAGTGGNAELSVSVKHHDKAIPSATVYVKYNAKEFPGSDVGKYDASAVCGNTGHALGHTHLEHLSNGYYYFYSVGYDSAISQTVSGGIGLHIKYAQRKDKLELTVPVTE